MLDQKPVQLFESACKKCAIYIENDMALGAFHDFLMLVKGNMVDRMVAEQKRSEAEAAAMVAEQKAVEAQEAAAAVESPACCAE